MTQREFTPAEYAECARQALGNWDFDAELDNGRSEQWCQDFKEALDFGNTTEAQEAYAADSFADDDGVIRLDRAYSDVWDKLYEFATNCADNALEARSR